MDEKKEMGRATAMRKYFPNLSLQEIKEFKMADPKGYEEVGNDCVAHYGAKVKEVV